MQDIQSVIRAASRRLYISDSFRTLAVTTTIGAGGLIAARIAEKTFGFAIPWQTTILATAAGAVVSAAAWSFARRKRALAVAREIDERADLKESLSTALCVEASTDPWARMVVETAQERAKAVKVGEVIPIAAPRFWPVPIAAAAAFALVYFNFPTIDLTGRIAQQEEEVRREREVIEVKAEVEKKREDLQKALAKAKVELENGEDPEAAAGDPMQMQDPDAIRRALVKELTTANDKLAEMREGEKAAQLQNLKDALRQLRQPGPGPLDEFSRQLARGNFEKAQEALNEISRQMADSSMSEEQKEQLKKQMENLAEQMKKLGDQQEQVAKELQKQGLDKKTAEELAKKAATDPQALQEAMEQMQNLTPEQKEQLLKMAKAAAECAGQCEGMGQGLSQMAQGMMQEGLDQEGIEGMENVMSELSAAEMLQSDMEALDAALDEVKSQMASLGGQMGNCSGKGEGEGQGEGQGLGGGLGQWAQGDSSNPGQGSGGPGKGNGASPEAMAADYTIENKKSKVETTAGPIIGQRLVYGEQVRGESRAGFEDGVEAGASDAREAMESMTVPREYHDAVKHYFGRLQSKVSKTAAEKPAEGTSGGNSESEKK